MIHQLHDDDEPLGAPRLRGSPHFMVSEAWPAKPFRPAPYRAAYWRAADRVAGGLILTDREHLAMTAPTLAQAAQSRARKAGLLLGGGLIVIIGLDGRDEWVGRPS